LVAIAVVGPKDSGKTLAVEALVRGFSSRGYRVATLKHIPEREFTIDTPGKDTWRHAEAGAEMVAAVSPNEIAIIRKVDTTTLSMDEILSLVENHADIVILEGFKGLAGKKVPKVVAVRSREEALEAAERYRPILAFVGLEPISGKLAAPYVDLPRNGGRLVDILEPVVSRMVEVERERRAITIRVDGRKVALRRFVREIVRNTISAMLSSLKGVEIKDADRILVEVRRESKSA